jgi:hypothetical protein
MEGTKRAFISIIIVIALVFIFYIITSTITKYTGFSISEKISDNEKNFKDCLDKNNIVLYINTDDASETLELINLNNYLDNIKIFNCLKNKQSCIENEISLFPTWIINENKVEKDISILELEKLSGCKLI